MPLNKSHHFVPQFYLRNFGVGNSISLFNIPARRHIRQASIAGQCQRSYLYGEDGKIEGVLAEAEGRACNSIRNVIASGQAPSDMSVDFFSLIMFVAFQHGRTPQAGEILDEIATKVSRAVFKMPGLVPEERHADIPKLRWSWRKAALQSLGIAAETSHVLLDLTPLILINDTPYAFITSDSPVAFFNSWCRGWRGGGVTGFASAGLQIALPLSPRHALLLYDAEVYSVMSKAGALRLGSYHDVKGLNALQLLTATNNLYYREDPRTLAEIEGLPFNWHYDRVAAVRVNRAVADDQRSQLVHLFQQQPEVGPDLSFIRVRRELRGVPLQTRARRHRESALEAFRLLKQKRRPQRLPSDLGSRVWHVVDSE